MRMLLFLTILLLSGCATVGSGGGVKTDQVCFSRAETGEILKKIERLRGAVASCKRGAQYDAKKTGVECQALVARWRIEAQSCASKLQACSKRRCPRCVLPWVLVGVGVAVIVVGGSVFAYREITR